MTDKLNDIYVSKIATFLNEIELKRQKQYFDTKIALVIIWIVIFPISLFTMGLDSLVICLLITVMAYNYYKNSYHEPIKQTVMGMLRQEMKELEFSEIGVQSLDYIENYKLAPKFGIAEVKDMVKSKYKGSKLKFYKLKLSDKKSSGRTKNNFEGMVFHIDLPKRVQYYTKISPKGLIDLSVFSNMHKININDGSLPKSYNILSNNAHEVLHMFTYDFNTAILKLTEIIAKIDNHNKNIFLKLQDKLFKKISKKTMFTAVIHDLELIIVIPCRFRFFDNSSFLKPVNKKLFNEFSNTYSQIEKIINSLR